MSTQDSLENRFLDFVRKSGEQFDGLFADISELRQFGESLLLLMLDIAVRVDPVDRLVSVFRAAGRLPLPVLERYVAHAIRRSYESGLPFEKLATSLLRGLEDKAKQVVSTETIAKTYGLDASREWARIIGEPDSTQSHGRMVTSIGGHF
jgi:hypothetical protein